MPAATDVLSDGFLKALPIAMLAITLFTVSDYIEAAASRQGMLGDQQPFRLLCIAVLLACTALEYAGRIRARESWRFVARFAWQIAFGISITFLPPPSDESIVNAAAYTAFTLIGTSLIWRSIPYHLAMMVPALLPLTVRLIIDESLPATAAKYLVIGSVVSLTLAWMHAFSRHQVAQLSGQLAYQARHDPLTGLLNRGAWTAEATTLLDLSGTTTLLYIDADGLKRVNDARGHHAGDIMLVGIADALRRHCPDDAAIGRIGGDEFAVVLPAHHREDAERIHRQVEGQLARIDGGYVSATFGVAEQHAEETLASLLDRADRAMLTAKAARDVTGFSRTTLPEASAALMGNPILAEGA